MSPSRSALLPRLTAAVAACSLAACASNEPKRPATEPADPPAVTSAVDLPDHPVAGASQAFWDHWGDGKAEVAGYRGKVSRYGEVRDAEVVLIWVTEPHDRRTWIKDDQASDAHRVQVLKLNRTAKFRTGVYPYSAMTSVFAPVADWGRPRFGPTKVTLTTQEWCGNVFHGIWPGADGFVSEMHSYFAGEGDQRRRVATPPDTLYEDALPIQLRELDGPFAGGGDWRGHLVPRLWERRKAHVPLVPVPATITRTEAMLSGQPITRFELAYADRTVTYDVGRDAPHRLLRWARSDGTELALVGHARLPYWRLNNPGDASYLEAIGLAEPAADPGAEPGATP